MVIAATSIALFLQGVALAEEPPDLMAGSPTTIDLTGALSFPTGGFGAGTGGAVSYQLGLSDRWNAGPAFLLRFPSRAAGRLDGPSLTEPVDWESHLSMWALGLRSTWSIVEQDAVLALRAALAVGFARVRQETVALEGGLLEKKNAPWIAPGIDVGLPAGPVEVTLGLAYDLAPTALVVQDDRSGASGARLGVGIHLEI